MRERPISFIAPMVRAILDGTKTQTRRMVKPQPYLCLSVEEWMVRALSGVDSYMRPIGSVVREELVDSCPYGRPGDRLIVRESAWLFGRWKQDGTTPRGRPRWRFEVIDRKVRYERPLDHELTYRGSEYPGYAFRPSIHMPRWASRLTLEITDVRVELLQDISKADAIAEGVTEYARSHLGEPEAFTAYGQFEFLWNAINGDGSWDDNPWVWVITFRRVGA